MRDGAGMNAGGDESGDMRHIHEKERANGLRGFGNALKIDDSGVGAGAGNDHFWLVLVGKAFNLVVIYAFVFLFHVLTDEFVHWAGAIQPMPTRKVAAMGK